MTKSQILLVLFLVPLFAFAQKKNQKLAEMTYNAVKSTVDAATSEKRDAYVKSLNGVLEMAKNKSFIDKVNSHKSYLESLEYFEIPKANTSLINDSLVATRDLKFEKAEGKYYIEPNQAFKDVIGANKTGAYLYLYINEFKAMYLEFVNYTNGKKLLYIDKAKLKLGDKAFEYYLNWVKSKDNGFEYCSIETNTQNFIDIFNAISNYTGEVSIEFTGEKGSRTATISKEMIEEIKTVFDLYSELKTTE